MERYTAAIFKLGDRKYFRQFASEVEREVWLAEHISKNTFGLPSRPQMQWDPITNEDVPTGVILPCEYSVVLEDIGDELKQREINETAMQLLKETDWYVTRFLETNVPIPAEVRAKRSMARLSIK